MRPINRPFLFLSLLALFLTGASCPLYPAEKSTGEMTAADADAPAGNATLPLNEAEKLNKLSEHIVSEKMANNQALQEKEIADQLHAIDTKQKILKEAAVTASATEGALNSVIDPEALLKWKLAQTEREKELVEEKAAFLREKNLSQNLLYEKIQFYLNKIFSEDASFFVVTDEIKWLRATIAAQLNELWSLNVQHEEISSRIKVEEKYFAAKNILITVAKENEKAAMQETIALEEDRLNVVKAMKALIEEKIKFAELRVDGAQEFDELLRLRRLEILTKEITSKKSIPYHPVEITAVLLSALLLLGFFLIRRRFFLWIQELPSYMKKGFFSGLGKTLWILGFLSLMVYAALNLLGFRAASMVFGLVYLNLAAGLLLFGGVAGLVAWFSMTVLQKIAKANQAEIKQSSAAFWFLNTVLIWLILGTIFVEILKWWALKKEVTDAVLAVANYPLFQSEKIKISLWNLGRSVLAVWFFNAVARFFNDFLKSFVYPKTHLDKNSQHAIRTLIRFFFMVAGLITGIQLLGIDLGSLAVFSGALGVGIGFGLQDIIKNIFSGFVIFFERPIRIGDVVEVGNVPGKVKSIRTRSTIVNTFDNVSIVVPNSEFLTQRVVNWSHSDRIVRVVSGVGVAYGSDVTAAKQILLEIAKTNPKIVVRPEPFVIFEEFADSALLFKLFYWVDVDDRLTVKSEINFSIHEKFKEKGIVIPFPQREIHIKSSDFDLAKKETQ